MGRGRATPQQWASTWSGLEGGASIRSRSTVSAAVEAWVRKPTYADFLRLRDDTGKLSGWWRNRVSRVLLNFFLTSLGTAIGVWTGGLRMLGTLFG